MCAFSQNTPSETRPSLELAKEGIPKYQTSPGVLKQWYVTYVYIRFQRWLEPTLSPNENHKFYNSTVQAISIVVGYFTTNVGSMCAHFVGIGDPVKTQVKNSLNKLFDFQGHTIDVYDQSVFTLKHLLFVMKKEIKST